MAGKLVTLLLTSISHTQKHVAGLLVCHVQERTRIGTPWTKTWSTQEPLLMPIYGLTRRRRHGSQRSRRCVNSSDDIHRNSAHNLYSSSKRAGASIHLKRPRTAQPASTATCLSTDGSQKTTQCMHSAQTVTTPSNLPQGRTPPPLTGLCLFRTSRPLQSIETEGQAWTC